MIEADASYALRVDGAALPPERADPGSATRPVRECLATLDAAPARMAGEEDGDEPPERLAGEPAPARSLSLTDPAAAWTSKGACKACFACAVSYLVDLKRAVVVDAAATPARRTAEVASTPVMIERTRRRFGLLPSRLAGDAAYGTGLLMGQLVGWLRRQGIEPHVPGLDGERQKAKGLFGRADFAFDPARVVYVCPAGHDVPTTGHVVPGRLKQCRAKATTCGPCALKARCTAGAARMVTRQSSMRTSASTHRRLAGTPAFKRSARERRRVERQFAHLKRNLGRRRLRLRGPTGAGGAQGGPGGGRRRVASLAAAAQNL